MKAPDQGYIALLPCSGLAVLVASFLMAMVGIEV